MIDGPVRFCAKHQTWDGCIQPTPAAPKSEAKAVAKPKAPSKPESPSTGLRAKPKAKPATKKAAKGKK